MEQSYIDGHEASGFKVGDKVRVTRIAEDVEDGWGACWATGMDQTVNQVFKINMDGREDGFFLSNGFYYPYFVLELASKSFLEL